MLENQCIANLPNNRVDEEEEEEEEGEREEEEMDEGSSEEHCSSVSSTSPPKRRCALDNQSKINHFGSMVGVIPSVSGDQEKGQCSEVTNIDDNDLEAVLVVPKRLCQSAYAVLLQSQCVPRPWHLEGRFGSRTHPIDEQQKNYLGIPLISVERLNERAATCLPLQEMLQTAGVRVIRKPIVTCARARAPPEVDARIHPERAPPMPTMELSPSALPIHDRGKLVPAFTYAELFAGIGGFGVALDALGGKCVFCSELEDHCRAVYRRNFDTEHVYGDIYEVPDDALPTSLDLLVGGFPCQPFSSMGNQPGLTCPKGLLFMQIVRVLNISKPKAFLLENVPGLLQLSKDFATIITALSDAGYSVTTEICCSRGLTATNRKRLFFVGLRRDMPATMDNPDPTNTTSNDTTNQAHPLSQVFQFPYVPDLKIRAYDVLEYDSVDDIETLRLADKTMNQLLTGKRWLPARLAWPNLVCDTLISHYGKAVGRGGSQLVPCQAPHNPRRFSPRECARIMGFPNSFQLGDRRDGQGKMANFKQQYAMFGNAVCPPLIAALAGAVLAHCPGIGACPSTTCMKAGCCSSDQTKACRNDEWVEWGREVAIRLAYAALVPKPPQAINLGCVPLSFLLETRSKSRNKMTKVKQ